MACHDSSNEEAKIASEFALEKLPIASWRPLRAIPPWAMARFRVSVDCEIQARWEAEKARMECMTKGYEEAMLKNLPIRSASALANTKAPPASEGGGPTHFGMFSAQTVSLEVRPRNISLEMDDRWWIRRRSVLE